MQILETSNGDYIVFGVDTMSDVNQIEKLAENNPTKLIVVSDVVLSEINGDTILGLLGEGKPSNITASKELWKNLRPENFKKIRRSLFIEEFGNIIASDVDSQQISVERAAKALEVLGKEYGISEIKLGNRFGREAILVNKDSQDCIASFAVGRADNDGAIFEKQVAPHLKLSVFPDDGGDEPLIFRGMRFIPFYETNTKIVYVPDKDSINGLRYFCATDTFSEDRTLSLVRGQIALECINGENYEVAELADFTDMYSEFIDYFDYYIVEIDGDVRYRNASDSYEWEPERDAIYRIIPTLTRSK